MTTSGALSGEKVAGSRGLPWNWVGGWDRIRGVVAQESSSSSPVYSFPDRSRTICEDWGGFKSVALLLHHVLAGLPTLMSPELSDATCNAMFTVCIARWAKDNLSSLLACVSSVCYTLCLPPTYVEWGWVSNHCSMRCFFADRSYWFGFHIFNTNVGTVYARLRSTTLNDQSIICQSAYFPPLPETGWVGTQLEWARVHTYVHITHYNHY